MPIMVARLSRTVASAIALAACGGAAGPAPDSGPVEAPALPAPATPGLVRVVPSTSATGTTDPSLALTPLLARASNVDIVVEVGGGPQVYVSGRRVTEGEAIRFSPAAAAGHWAYAESVLDVGRSRVVLDGAVIFDDGLASHLAFTASGTLHFLHAALGAETYEHCAYAPGSGVTSCAPLEFVPSDLVADGESVVIGGYQPSSGHFIARRAGEAGVREIASAVPLSVVKRDGRAVVVQTGGTTSLFPLFFAYERLATAQLGEPFAFGGDGMGRLAWNVSYRLRAIGELHRRTGDLRLRALARSLALVLAGRLDENGRVTSWKYSRDRSTPIVLAVNQGMIHHALLSVADLLDWDERTRVIAGAARMLESFESDWVDGAYRQTPCIAKDLDGIVLPFNQQNALGLVALDLWHATGEQRFRDRVEALYDNLVGELDTKGGVQLWHYWPAWFYAGWSAGETPSCHSPSRAAKPDPFFSDTEHAAIDAEFVVAAASALHRPRPIDLEAIAGGVAKGPRAYSRFLSGDTSKQPASWSLLPPVAFAREAYGSRVAMPYADWDEQPRLLSHALAFDAQAAPAQATVDVTVSHLGAAGLEPIEQLSLGVVAMLDFWLAIGQEAKGSAR